jgi:UPF0755 protein
VVVAIAVSCSKPEPPAYQSVADKIMVTIPRGATYYQALDSLESKGVIKNRDWFSLYARMRGLPSNLKSGVYLFEPDESWSSVVTTLKKGRGMEARFTVLEGMMGFEVAERARSWLGISPTAFKAAMRTPFERELGITDTRRGEGYMYPDGLRRPMRMPARPRPTHDARVSGAGSPNGTRGCRAARDAARAVTLLHHQAGCASPDRAYVSAVYRNRLKRGMALRVIHGGARARPAAAGMGRLPDPSPYNTYIHPGLPRSINQ